MLQYKSFKLSDDKGMNELLEKYLLAGGVSIAVSNGEICIPYNDGREFNKEQKLSLLQGQKEEAKQKFDVINLNHRILEKQLAGATVQLEASENRLELAKVNQDKDDNKKTYIDKQTLKEKVKRLKNVKDQLTLSITNTRAELTRQSLEVEVLDELIGEVV